MDSLSIKINAILNTQQSEVTIQQQMKQIQDALKPFNLNINTAELTAAFDKITNSMKIAADGTVQIKNNLSLVTEQGKQVNIVLNDMKVEQLKIVDNTKQQTVAEQKKSAELEKQIALFKEQKAIQLQNISSQYGSLYNSTSNQSQVSSIQSAIGGLNVENAEEQFKRINTDISQVSANLKEARVQQQGFFGDLVNDAGKMIAWTVVKYLPFIVKVIM